MTQRTGTLNPVTLDHADDAITRIVKSLASARDGSLITSGRRHKRFAPLLAGSETELLDWKGAINRFLSLSGGSPKPLAPERIQIQAVEHALRKLPAGGPFYESSSFRGTAVSVSRALAELESWCIWDVPQTSFEPYDQVLIESLYVVRAERAAQLQTLGRGTLGANLRALLFDPASFKIDHRIVILSDVEDGQIPFRLASRLSELGADVTHITLAPSKLEAINVPVVLEASGDRLSECEWALRRCATHIASGVPADQIVLFARHLNEYGPLLRSVAARFDVPISLSYRFPLLSNGYAKLMLSLLASFQSKDPRMLVRNLNSSFINLARDAYSVHLDLARKSAADSDPWAWFETNLVAQGHTNLGAVLEWRIAALKASIPLREWIDQFKRLFAELPLADDVLSDSQDRERNARAQTVMSQTLAAHASLSRVRYLSFHEFLGTAEEEWRNADVSSPGAEDGIQIVDNIDSFPEAQALHVLGLIEGEFPRRRTEDPILSDRLRNQISDALKLEGLARLQTSHDRARHERELVARLCRLPSQQLTLSYPVTTSESESVPAYALQEIREKASGFSEVAHARNAWAPEAPELAADRGLANTLSGPRLSPSDSILTAATRQTHQLDPNHRFGFRELEDAVQCPFRHFVKHRLRLSSNNEFSKWSHLVDIPRSARLATFENEPLARAALELRFDAVVDQLVGEAEEWEVNLMKAVRNRFIDGWLNREFTARQAWERDQSSLKEDRQVNVKPENPIFPGVAIRDTLPVVYENGGLPSTQIYKRTGKPEVDELLDYRLFQSTLMCVLLWNSGGTVEIDHGFGTRTLLVWNTRHGFRHTRPLEVINPAPIKLKGVKRDLQILVQSAAKAAMEVDIEPRPDDHCQACDFGELCRSSRDFAEATSPFDFPPRNV